MNKQILFTTAVCLAVTFKLSAQTQVDHSIQLTGSGSNAEITGVKVVANGQDAVNDSSVQRDILKYAAATGLGTNVSPYIVNLNPAVLATYTTGMVIYFQAPAACLAGPVYINVNSLGNQVIKENATIDLAAGDIALNQLVAVQYDGTNFEMQSQLGNTATPSLFTHYVGELFGGGIVVAVWDSLGYERGLIASLADVATNVAFSNVTTGIGATAESPSNGNNVFGVGNTYAIVNQSGASSGAAWSCAHYTNSTGGLYGSVAYSDWYLPSLFEMLQIYRSGLIINRVVGDALPVGTGTGIFLTTASAYWTSTENSGTTTDAWRVSNGAISATGIKSTATSNARAVRRF